MVTVRGARPRTVPVLARYHARLLAAARFAGTGLICGGADPGRRNLTNPLISALDGGGGLPRLDTSRLRATWLAELRGAARAGHVHARGRDQLLPAARRPGRRAGAGRRGRGGAAARGSPPAMIPLAAFEEIIDASGVAPRIEADAARRGAAPAAERPHPAGRDVPGPGRPPARAPDPGAPGADRAARGRPAAARRDRGLEARPAPADLPADRAHLRPGRGRARRGRARRAALRPAAARLRRPARGIGIPEQFKDASRSLAVDWTDLESFSRPPPHGTSDCADPEASWGHRKNNLLRSQDELFYGYYLSAGIMMPEENGPAVPELARRATLSSCRHDPVRAFAPVLTAMPGQGIPLGDILDDSGYAHRDAGAWAIPLRAAGAAARPGPAPPRPRPQGHPRRRDHRQRQPVLPADTPPAAGTRAARPHRHQRASRGPRPQDRRAGPVQARPPHRRRPRRLPPGAVPRRHGQDPLPAPPRRR